MAIQTPCNPWLMDGSPALSSSIHMLHTPGDFPSLNLVTVSLTSSKECAVLTMVDEQLLSAAHWLKAACSEGLPCKARCVNIPNRHMWPWNSDPMDGRDYTNLHLIL